MNKAQAVRENLGVADVFVSGLGGVEDIGGGCFRFTFFTMQEIGGRQELLVSAKIIMSAEALPGAMTLTARMTNTCACENVRLQRN